MQLLPAPALLPTPTRFRKRSAHGLDPISEAPPPYALEEPGSGALDWSTNGGRTGGIGLGVSLDEEEGGAGRAPKRARVSSSEEVEPAFANLSLATPPRHPPTLFTSSPPPSLPLAAQPFPAPSGVAPPLNPIPPDRLLPPLAPPPPPKELPVTPPMQQGESAFPQYAPPPIIRTHRPTPTPSPPTSYDRRLPSSTEDSKMSSSYDINLNVVYVASLSDSDDDDSSPNPAPSASSSTPALELHPAFLAATSGGKPPSPLPPELLPRIQEEMGLVLYRPLKFGGTDEVDDKNKRDEAYREFQRNAAAEAVKYSVGSSDEDPGVLGDVEDVEDVEMMDIDD